jgi:hypothetical protein
MLFDRHGILLIAATAAASLLCQWQELLLHCSDCSRPYSKIEPEQLDAFCRRGKHPAADVALLLLL